MQNDDRPPDGRRRVRDAASDARNPPIDERHPPSDARHADPLTGEPGSHPLGTGAGALGGAAAGAAIGGAIGGPPGATIGGIIGAVGGGAAGHGLGEAVNPSEEDRFWRANYHTRPYTDDDAAYDVYRPAFRFGWESRIRYFDRRWDDVEPTLAHQWERRHESELTWARARAAARDAWNRAERQMNG